MTSRTILAIETSTRSARIAVVRGEEVLFKDSYISERSHNARIFEPLGRALASHSDLDGITIGTGPGSYVGIRIGISTAVGISLIRSIPLFGLPSLVGMVDSEGTPVTTFRAVGDARRGQLWTAKIEDGALTEPPLAQSTENTQSILEDCDLPLYTPDEASPLAELDIALVRPSSVELARRTAALPDEAFAKLAQTPPSPIYLAAPFVTQPAKAGKA